MKSSSNRSSVLEVGLGTEAFRSSFSFVARRLMENESGGHVDCSSARRDHKVFLSHSGAQKGFVEQLCVDLERCDRYPFFDKRHSSLPFGENFPQLIFQAIQGCQVGVVVLSQDFFIRTKWPMLELVAMVKFKQQNPNFMIIPVFLHISHTECRDEMNRSHWLSVWSQWALSDNRINLQEWKEAFELLGPTKGLAYNEGLGEVKFREEIVEAICMVVPPKNRWDDSHVQGKSRVCKVIREMIDRTKLSRSYGVRLVGLYGVIGIGKTTACKALCNDLFSEFQGRVCHVELENGSEIEFLKEVLKRLTNTRPKVVDGFNLNECRNRLNEDLHKQRVFLVIDNVSVNGQAIEQAKTYLRAKYAHGSAVMVTARSLGQLQNLKIHEGSCLEMPELEEIEARALFLHHSAPKNEVNDTVVRRCLERCYFRKGDGNNYHYHPLALKVLGVQFGCDPEKWVVHLTKFDSFNPLREIEHPIFSILKKSFNLLSPEDQLLLLDVALFHPERSSWSKWINVFEWLAMVHGISKDDVKERLEVLKRKSFLEDLGDGTTIIGMHDLWREFSVMETRVGEYNQRRWVYDVHGPHFRPEESSLGDGGWRSLQRICSKGSASNSIIEVNLTDCSNTKVLKLIDLQLDESVLDLKALRRLKSLEFLSRRGTWVPQIEVLGLQFLTNLVVLKLDNIPTNSICVEEIAILTNLQILQLHSGIENTNKLPDLEDLVLLQMVTFCFGDGAETISGLSSWMTNLQYLDLGWCGSLRSCHGVGELVALEELELSYCEKLEELPDLQRLTNLKKLNIIGCKLLKALPGLGDLVALRVLRAKFCKKLAELPDMHKLTNLQVLDIRYVKLRHVPGLEDLISLQELLADFQALKDRLDLPKLMELQTMEIRGWGSQGLPCVLRLANVKSLTIWNCTGVAELAGLSNLSGLQALSVGYCGFKDVSGLSRLTALQSLTIQQCNELESLPDLSQLLKLELLDIRACHRLRDWSRETPGPDLLCAGTLPQLETLKCSYLPITELPDLSHFPRLKELDLDHCGGLLSLSSSEPLTALEVLMLSSCRNLKTLPDLSCSKRLLYFKLLYCGVRVNTQEIEKLRAMCSRLVFRSAESEI